jgi:hypothetical protein
LACELVYRCRDVSESKTLWLIPSVQVAVWRAVNATLDMVNNPKLSAVFVHPMYGPNGFRETEIEARTFQNVLTGTHQGPENPLNEEISRITGNFHTTFHIGTNTEFGAEEKIKSDRSEGKRPTFALDARAETAFDFGRME